MEIPKVFATRQLKCNGRWLRVEVYAPRFTEIPFGGGRFLGTCSEFKVPESPLGFLTVGIDGGHLAFLSRDEKLDMHSWIPKAGLVALIEVLCSPDVPREHLVSLQLPRDWSVDPQKSDMRFYRDRCRHDVMRVIRNRLATSGASMKLLRDDLAMSPLLTRLYDNGDLVAATRYWGQRGILTDPMPNGTYTIDETQDGRVYQIIEDYEWEEANVPRLGEPVVSDRKRIDVFICHASEDKDEFVRGLAEALRVAGLEVWYDEYSLKLGDSLRRSIDRGLAKARYGIVVVSKAFFDKNWPQYELDGLVQRESSSGDKVILPIWHQVSKAEVEAYSPSLAGRVAASSRDPIDEIVKKILEVVKPN